MEAASCLLCCAASLAPTAVLATVAAAVAAAAASTSSSSRSPRRSTKGGWADEWGCIPALWRLRTFASPGLELKVDYWSVQGPVFGKRWSILVGIESWFAVRGSIGNAQPVYFGVFVRRERMQDSRAVAETSPSLVGVTHTNDDEVNNNAAAVLF